MQKRVALIGLPTAGKTSVGAIVAGLMGLPFVDLDDEIASEAKASIPDIFERGGEAAFRAWEKKALERVAARESLVLATGGGCVETPENRALLRERFTVVWLRVSPAAAARRSIGSDRPLLVGDARAKIEYLYERRLPWYQECAELEFDTDMARPIRVAEAIRDALL